MRETKLAVLICLLLSAASIFLALKADAKEFKLLELQDLGVNYRNYEMVNDKARNLLIYPEHPKEGIDVMINSNIFKYGYWDSTIESLTTGAQYRSIGLQMRLGIRASDSLELGYWHHSQHVLDRQGEGTGKFPAEDALEVRFYFFKSKEKRPGIF